MYIYIYTHRPSCTCHIRYTMTYCYKSYVGISLQLGPTLLEFATVAWLGSGSEPVSATISSLRTLTYELPGGVMSAGQNHQKALLVVT